MTRASVSSETVARRLQLHMYVVECNIIWNTSWSQEPNTTIIFSLKSTVGHIIKDTPKMGDTSFSQGTVDGHSYVIDVYKLPQE